MLDNIDQNKKYLPAKKINKMIIVLYSGFLLFEILYFPSNDINCINKFCKLLGKKKNLF